MRRMLKVALIGSLALGLVAPAIAGEPRHYPRGQRGFKTQAMTKLHLGLFTPDGNSAFWDDQREVFTGDPEDFEDANWLLDFEWATSPRLSIVISTGYFNGEQDQAYLDYVDEFGNDIWNTASLRISPLTVGVTLYPGGRDGRINPYLGAGGGFYWWRYREAGDFVFFDEFGEPDFIDFDVFESDGVALGYYLLAGLDFRVTPATSVFVEGRWSDADDELDEQFEGFGEIDLSGQQVSAGIAWRF